MQTFDGDVARLLQEDVRTPPSLIFKKVLRIAGVLCDWHSGKYSWKIIFLSPAGDEGLHNLVQLGVGVCGEGTVLPDLVEQALKKQA